MVLQVVGLADIFIGLRVALVGIKPAVLSVYITVPVAVAVPVQETAITAVVAVPVNKVLSDSCGGLNHELLYCKR